jgi:hypothetical protein
MPRATVDITDTRRVDLKSCTGGYVILRRLNYGEFLKRREMNMQMSIDNAQGKQSMDIQMLQTAVTQFEFRACIVEHNLENHTGELLDFKLPYTLTLLDPRIGQEISDSIDSMNQFSPDDEGNS